MVKLLNFVGIVVIPFLLISIMFSAVDIPPVALIMLGLSWWFLYWCFMTYDFAINISWVGG